MNHGADIQALWDRCKGFADAIGADYKKSTMDSGEDPTVIESKVAAYLRSHPDTHAILALGPDQAMGVLRGVNDAGKAGKLYVATFDLSPDILKAIQAGQIQFAIDQQPYLQGYLPVAFLTEYARYGVIPANNVNTGPGFVTKKNIALVEKLAGEYR